ncbi:MBL fold metallo-hydrolase [Aerococcaceae bacterium DSM 111020]|nr:MBL fold metallo-hydrolase [Aerococcaceae bacterium DSM 111020]
MYDVEYLTVAGQFMENCYAVIHPESREALIIDPGGNETEIIDWIAELNIQPIAILLTHAHSDHIGAVDALRDEYGILLYVYYLESDHLTNPRLNLSALYPGEEITVRPADIAWVEPDLTYQQIGPFYFEMGFAPGHSPGHVIFKFLESGFVISGDVIFQGSIGRTDLPGGDTERLMQSIREEIYTLPDETVLYPGHGSQTTVAHEKQTNPFNRMIFGN